MLVRYIETYTLNKGMMIQQIPFLDDFIVSDQTTSAFLTDNKRNSIYLDGLSNLRSGGGSNSEAILCSSGNMFHVTHSAGTLALSSLDLQRPVIYARKLRIEAEKDEDTVSNLGSRVSASSADMLLLVESGLTASTAKGVSLGLSKTERRGTFSFDL